MTADEQSSPEPPAEEAVVEEPRFGTPGLPLDRRNPFLIGLLGGLGVLLAYAIFLGIRNAASILVLIFIAGFLAIGLNPAVSRLRAWGVPRGGAVAIVALTVVGLLAGGIIALIPPLVTQTNELIHNVPDYIASLQRNETINELVERYGITAKVSSALNAGTVGNAVGGVVGGAKLLFGTIFNTLTVLVLTIYFMAAFDRLREARLPGGAGVAAQPGAAAHRRDPHQGRRLHGRRAGDRGAGRGEHLRARPDHRAGLSVRAGRGGRDLRPDPADRRHPGRDHREPGGLRLVAQRRHRLRRLLRRLPADRELPDLSRA